MIFDWVPRYQDAAFGRIIIVITIILVVIVIMIVIAITVIVIIIVRIDFLLLWKSLLCNLANSVPSSCYLIGQTLLLGGSVSV